VSRPFSDPVLRRVVETILREVDPAFDFVDGGPIPWCAAPPESATAPVALVTTAGLHVAGDRPFRSAEDPLGDPTFRVIPHGTSPFGLDLAQPYVDQRYIPRDPEVALPQAALESLCESGLAGSPAPRHISFSGGLVRPLPGLDESARRVTEIFREDGVGAVVLVPSCPLCVQTVCLVARRIERAGIPTVCLTLVPELTGIVGAPRSLALKFPFGAPCGDPGNRALHRQVLEEALGLLHTAVSPGVVQQSRLAWRH
jgi:D-proline reductase (dithiol) PrdB